jgi:hypothetical protein
MWHVMGRREMHADPWWETLKKRAIESLRSRWKDNIKVNLMEMKRKGWPGMIWLRIGLSAVWRVQGSLPSTSIKCEELVKKEGNSLSYRTLVHVVSWNKCHLPRITLSIKHNNFCV